MSCRKTKLKNFLACIFSKFLERGAEFYERKNSSEVLSSKGHLRLRQHIYNGLDKTRIARRCLLEMPSILHGPSTRTSERRSHRTLQATLCQIRRKKLILQIKNGIEFQTLSHFFYLKIYKNFFTQKFFLKFF